jgi:peroxiredoxin
VQLQEHKAAFDEAGIALVALTYDTPELQAKFVDKYSIGYPVLSDVDATSVRNLGILNTDYAPGHSAYGIPYPGIFIVRPDGTIAGKLFLEGYTTRVDTTVVLAFAIEALE